MGTYYRVLGLLCIALGAFLQIHPGEATNSNAWLMLMLEGIFWAIVALGYDIKEKQ